MNEKRIFVIVFLTPRCTATVCVLAGPDFHSLFQYLGFRLSNRTFSALVMRYSSKNGNIEFGDFILCAIRMKTMLGKGNNSSKREREREREWLLDEFLAGFAYFLSICWRLGVEKSTGSFFYLIIILCFFIDITASFRNIDVDNSGHAAFDLDTVSISVKILAFLSI